MKKRLTLILTCLIMVFILGSCGSASDKDKKEDTKLDDVKSAGVMKVGMCPEYPPFETINKDGDIEGFDADLAKAIAEEIGVKVEFVNTPYEGLIAGLTNGDFDIIMSGMSPREADQADKSLNVSESYYLVKEVVMTKDPSIKTKEDLKGKKVGSHVGSTSEYAVNNLIEDGITCESMPYNRHSEAFADLQNGNLDAQVVENTWAKEKVKDGDGIMIMDGSIYDIEIAAIVAPGNASLRDAFDESFKTIKDSGKYDEIVAKWFS
jgi:ABC-type amino acid transport substrate-binding protein